MDRKTHKGFQILQIPNFLSRYQRCKGERDGSVTLGLTELPCGGVLQHVGDMDLKAAGELVVKVGGGIDIGVANGVDSCEMWQPCAGRVKHARLGPRVRGEGVPMGSYKHGACDVTLHQTLRKSCSHSIMAAILMQTKINPFKEGQSCHKRSLKAPNWLSQTTERTRRGWEVSFFLFYLNIKKPSKIYIFLFFVATAVGEARAGRGAQVGFKGLLEMSRDTWWHADPMLPSRPLSGTLEVVGTRHSSPGIRRLVKAVAGGLRACQVCAWPLPPGPLGPFRLSLLYMVFWNRILGAFGNGPS